MTGCARHSEKERIPRPALRAAVAVLLFFTAIRAPSIVLGDLIPVLRLEAGSRGKFQQGEMTAIRIIVEWVNMEDVKADLTESINADVNLQYRHDQIHDVRLTTRIALNPPNPSEATVYVDAWVSTLPITCQLSVDGQLLASIGGPMPGMGSPTLLIAQMLEQTRGLVLGQSSVRTTGWIWQPAQGSDLNLDLCTAQSFPHSWAGLEACDLIIAGDLRSDHLDQEQADTLREWVWRGGCLVIEANGGESALEALFPYRLLDLTIGEYEVDRSADDRENLLRSSLESIVRPYWREFMKIDASRHPSTSSITHIDLSSDPLSTSDNEDADASPDDVEIDWSTITAADLSTAGRAVIALPEVVHDLQGVGAGPVYQRRILLGEELINAGWHACDPAHEMLASQVSDDGTDAPRREGAVVWGPYGHGTIIVLGLDPLTLSSGGERLSGAAAWWHVTNVAPPLQALAESWGLGLLEEEDDDSDPNSWWSDYGVEDVLPASQVPLRLLLNRLVERTCEDIEIRHDLFAWIVASLIVLAGLIGPIDWYVLKRKNRLPWSWGTVILWVGVASIIIYLLQSAGLGTQWEIRRVRVVDVQQAWRRPFVTGVTSLFSSGSSVTQIRPVGNGSDRFLTPLSYQSYNAWGFQSEQDWNQAGVPIGMEQRGVGSVLTSLPVPLANVRWMMDRGSIDADLLPRWALARNQDTEDELLLSAAGNTGEMTLHHALVIWDGHVYVASDAVGTGTVHSKDATLVRIDGRDSRENWTIDILGRFQRQNRDDSDVVLDSPLDLAIDLLSHFRAWPHRTISEYVINEGAADADLACLVVVYEGGLPDLEYGRTGAEVLHKQQTYYRAFIEVKTE